MLNIVSLSSALIFTLVALMMIYNRDALDSFGQLYIDEYSRRFQEKYEIAITNIAANNIMLVEKQLDEWSEVLKGDRAYPKKRDLLRALSEKLHHTKQYVKMRHWTKLWLDLDDRDITAKAYYYEALRNIPESRDEGKQGLETTYKSFPMSHTSKKYYVASLRESGEIEEVNKVLSASICQQKRWQLFWDVGKGFNAKDSLPLLALTKGDNEMCSIRAIITGRLKALRIDPPPGSSVHITDLKLKTEVVVHDISVTKVRLHMMTADRGNLIVSGDDDPYFYFDVSKYYKSINDSNMVEVSFKVRSAEY